LPYLTVFGLKKALLPDKEECFVLLDINLDCGTLTLTLVSIAKVYTFYINVSLINKLSRDGRG
jgi:hypothetical protein